MEDNLNKLDIESRKIYMKALAYVALVDDNFDDGEKEFIKSLCQINDVNEEHLDEIMHIHSDEEIADLVKNAGFDQSLKLALIRDMFTIANSDINLSDKEIISIANIGEALNISLEKLEEISEWVIEGIEWRLKGEAIFDEDIE